MNNKAIFFDMDGVLIYSEPLHFAAWELILKKLKLRNSFTYTDLVGRSDHIFAKEIINRYELPNDITELVMLKRKTVISLSKQGFKTPAGRNEFLQSMCKKNKLFVVSSSSKAEVDTFLKAEKIIDYFTHIITADDVCNVKPNPEPYLTALKLSGYKSHETLVIEDSPSGIKAAQQAELPVIGMKSELNIENQFSNVKFFDNFDAISQHLCNLVF